MIHADIRWLSPSATCLSGRLERHLLKVQRNAEHILIDPGLSFDDAYLTVIMDD